MHATFIHRVRRGLSVPLVTLGLLALSSAPGAIAGTYTVRGCDESGRYDGWSPESSPNYGTAYGEGCPGVPRDAGGLLARSVGRADTTRAPYDSIGAWVFRAPAGTRIVGLSAYMRNSWALPWFSGIRDDVSRTWLSCGARCAMFWNWTYVSYGLNTSSISAATICVSVDGCRRDGTNSGWVRISNMTVTLADDWGPRVGFTGGSLLTPGWKRGVQSVGYAANDNLGIRTVRTIIDGQAVGRDDRPCDPHAIIPCPNAGTSSNLDTAVLFRPDGKHTITIEATDGSGNVISTSRTVYTDNTAPAQLGSLLVADAARWHALNGFTASWPAQVADHGSPLAGVSYELCPVGKATGCTRGSRQTGRGTRLDNLAVPREGAWTLRLWLRDQAGNQDANRSVVAGPLRYDATPPAVRLLGADPSDPARIKIQAADGISGVANMAIEIHRQGTAEWLPLPLTRSGNEFSAWVDDETLASGTYDVRARALDAAGNERTAAVDSAGRAATIQLPARIPSSLRAGRVTGRRHRHLDSRFTVPFGATTQLHGRLTGPGGNAVQNAAVEVWQRAPATNAAFTRFGTVVTGRRGGFAFRVPPGPNRVVRFRYPGTALQRGFTRDVWIGVHAATTMRVSPKSAVNGDSVRFTGRVRGRPLPLGGKLVELQVFTRRRWRTFAQPRAGRRSGKWRFDYRFEAISGRVTFRFRARIRREAAYPYELGTSRQVRVNVRGLG